MESVWHSGQWTIPCQYVVTRNRLQWKHKEMRKEPCWLRLLFGLTALIFLVRANF